MSQIHTPVTFADRGAALASVRARPTYAWWTDALAMAAFVAGAAGIVIAASHWAAPLTPATSISLSPSALPLYAGLSTASRGGR